MKLKNNFITHEIGDDQIMIATGNTDFNGMVKSNKTAAFIINCLKEDTTKEEIISRMMSKYDEDKKIIEADVDKILNVLYEIDAVEK